MFQRLICRTLVSRLREPRLFLQVLAGPRQVGKPRLVPRAMDALNRPAHYASGDEPGRRDRAWIEQQWEVARLPLRETRKSGGALLVLDEIQKIPHWSDVGKRLWEEDTRKRVALKVALLGSSPWLMQHGLTESLAGRFEIIPVTHWSYAEMREAFGWRLEQFLFFGGYPGAGRLTGIPKFAGQRVRQRGSSPKFQVLNNALMTAQAGVSFREAQKNRNRWGRLVESAIALFSKCGRS